jgi:homoserine O-acetyltransferase/O-succinyltransferase
MDFLGIKKAHAVVGSSLGGMQVFKFAAQYPDALDRAVSIAATGKTTPGTVAFRRVQRVAIMSDPEFKNGNYSPGPGPVAGLRVARELGTITYRSRDEFNERFEWKPQPPYEWKNACFEVETYLNAQAQKFTNVYDANCYLTLSRCMDLMDLGHGFGNYAEGVARITSKMYIIGVDRDLLIPLEEQEHLFKLMQALGKPVRFEIMSSLFGHDVRLILSGSISFS